MRSQLRILHLEIDPAASDETLRQLKDGGIGAEIRRVETLGQFEQSLLNEAFDLILGEYALEGIDALAAMRWARRQRPGTPFIFLSGSADVDTAIEAIKAGAADYVLKSRMQRLAPAVKRALHESREHAASDIHRTVEALHESERRLRATFDHAAIGIVEVDRNYQIVSANERFCRMLGYPCDELIGKSIHDLTSPEDRDLSRRMNEQLHDEARERAEYEKRYMRKDGSAIWVRVAITACRDDAGAWIGSIGTVEDISERMRDETSLREQAQMLDLSYDAVFAWPLHGPIRYWNLGAQQLYGYSREQALGRVSHELLRTQTDGGVETFRKALERNHLWSGELRHTTQDGREVIVESRMALIPGEAGGLVIESARDITQRKETERSLEAARQAAEAARAAAEDANNAKDQFLAILSHELRTPLTPVLTTASMLERDPQLPETYREDVVTIRRNVELEARLIDDLLDVTRIARGKIELHSQPVALCEVIRRAVEVCQSDIESRQLHFGVDLGADAPYMINADPARLQQVFWNLLKNAIKFTGHGGCLGIRCRLDEHDRSTVVAEVTDSGEGIDPSLLPHVFKPFEQGGSRVTRQFGGLGLGLTITKGLVEKHGGSIEAHSEGKGRGAAFRVRLPLLAAKPAQAPPVKPAETPAAVKQESEAAGPLRILLVEDHGDTARIMRRLLRMQGYDVDVAGDVCTALEMANARRFDLLVSDLGLPDGSGIDLIRGLREHGQEMPAIALSGYGQEQDLQRTREAGFAAHLTKPVNLDRLSSVINDVAGIPAGGARR